MFDIGFSELMVIAVVALVVIGPERLPGVARTLGHLFGRLQRYVNDVKADISREIELDELKKFKNEFQEAAQSVESSVRTEVAAAESTLNSIAAEANPEHAGTPDSPPAVPDAGSGPAAEPSAAPASESTQALPDAGSAPAAHATAATAGTASVVVPQPAAEQKSVA